jgi:replication initiation protein RepC
MQSRQPTTPFGRRSLTLAHVAAQMAASARQPDKVVHKWRIFRAICTARPALCVSERSLAVLNALLSFHPETTLAAEDDLIVFPSNEQLCLRTHGMPPSTLRRQLAALVDAGLIVRRDSPNGKRYARKGRGGEITLAFGFDLSPLAARAEEFERMAECPSSNDLRQFGYFRKGGSGSSVVEIKRHAGDAANDDLRWSGV